MWIEIVDGEGKNIGAVNSLCCDLIRMGADGPHGRAVIRVSSQEQEAYITRVGYLRLIESLTLSEVKTVKELAHLLKDAEEDAGPCLVMP